MEAAALTVPEGQLMTATIYALRAIFATLLFLLAAASAASAECAWVLWGHHETSGLDTWTPWNAVTNRADCQKVLASEMKVRSAPSANPDVIVSPRGPSVIDTYAAGHSHTLSLICLPDTVDPRGPKGK